MIYKVRYLLSLVLLCLPSYCEAQSGAGVKAQMTERPGQPSIYSTGDDDAEMNLAITKARETLKDFEAARSSGSYLPDYFAIKRYYLTKTGGEHIWISNISLKDGVYWGTVDNLPANIDALKENDTVQIPREYISDWMYVDNDGYLQGAYTIKLIRKRMSPEERAQFDAELGIFIKD